MNRRDFLRLQLLSVPLMAASTAAGQQQKKIPIVTAVKVKGPVVVSTWDSGRTANNAAWPILSKGGKALDAVEEGGRASELDGDLLQYFKRFVGRTVVDVDHLRRLAQRIECRPDLCVHRAKVFFFVQYGQK